MTTKNFKVRNGLDIGDNISITDAGVATGITTINNSVSIAGNITGTVSDLNLTAFNANNINLNADTIRVGDAGVDATITSNGTGDLILNTNAGTNSGSITIADGVDGTITIAPNGNGVVDITKNLTVDKGIVAAGTVTSGGAQVDTNGNVAPFLTPISLTPNPISAFYDNTTPGRRANVVLREYGQNTGEFATASTVAQAIMNVEGCKGTPAAPLINGAGNNNIGGIAGNSWDGTRWSTSNGIGSESFFVTQSTEAWSSATAIFTGSITGNILTVTAITSGSVRPGMYLTGTGIPQGTTIAGYGSNTFGNTGTYTLDVTLTTPVSSTTITGVGTTASGTRWIMGQNLNGVHRTSTTRHNTMILSNVSPSTTTINGVVVANAPGVNMFYGNSDSTEQTLVSTDGTKVYKTKGAMNLQVSGGGIFHIGTPTEDSANITGYIAANILTVTAVSSGTISPGQLVNATGIQPATFITSQTSGTTGGVGVYVVATTFATAGQTIGSVGTPVAMVTTPDNNAIRGTNQTTTYSHRKSAQAGRRAALKNNDTLYQYNYLGQNGTGFALSTNGNTAARMKITATGDFTATSTPTKWTLQLTPSGSLTAADVLTVDGTTKQLTYDRQYGSFYSAVAQPNLVANTVNPMYFYNTDIANGVSIVSNSRITTSKAGVYNIQFSSQFTQTGGGSATVYIWLQKNGVAVPESAADITLIGNNAKQLAAWNFVVSAAAGDYFEIVWQSSDTNVSMPYVAASGNIPGAPSAAMTITPVGA